MRQDNFCGVNINNLITFIYADPQCKPLYWIENPQNV